LLPAAFQSANPRIDATFRFVGPMLDRETRGDSGLELAGSEPVVYMSLGTLHRATEGFYRACLAAFADMPVRFVVSVGHQVDMQAVGTVPRNAVLRASVPQLAVLQRAAVFITHGGMNSVLEGLASGVPLLVIPQQPEQLLIGLHAAARGAGVVRREHLAGQHVDAATLRRDVEQILGTPRFKAAAADLQKVVHATGGIRQAADEIQAFASPAVS
jgi:MGT family glycosyltransferase